MKSANGVGDGGATGDGRGFGRALERSRLGVEMDEVG